MLKQILSISGKPGLYKLVSYGKNIIIVEGLGDKKRFPAYSYNKIISLGDIAIYTTEEEVPLANVFETIYKMHDGKTIDKAIAKNSSSLHEFFNKVLPDYDRDRVYDTDIKKVISWYNLLVEAGFDKFVDDKEENKEETNEDGKDADAANE